MTSDAAASGSGSGATSANGGGRREESQALLGAASQSVKARGGVPSAIRKGALKGGLKLAAGTKTGKGRWPQGAVEDEGAGLGKAGELPLRVKVEGQDLVDMEVDNPIIREGSIADKNEGQSPALAPTPDSLPQRDDVSSSAPLKKKEKKATESRRSEEVVVVGGVGSVNGSGAGQSQIMMTAKRLFVCEGCFKYMIHPVAFTTHKVSWVPFCSS